MKPLILLLTLLLSGCGAYRQAEVALAEQARRGLAMWSARETQHRQELAKTFDQRRQTIDDAFDADLRARPALEIEWVIEHRKAYAIALDALSRQHQSAIAATDTAQSNARAADTALARLQWLLSLESSLETLFTKGSTP